MKRLLCSLAAIGLAATACGGGVDQPAGDEPSGPAEIRLWLNGPDTPQPMRDWLTETFEEQHPGATLTIEEQQWEGLVDRLTTSLSSESETPDVVEVGNTQAATFSTAGAFSDITGMLPRLGGDDLLSGFVEAGSAVGRTYAVPLYAGSAYVFYRKDLFEKSDLDVPVTMAEFIDAAITLKEDNADVKGFSGFWLPGQDWRDGMAFVWDAGGELAVANGGWHGALSTPDSIDGLERVRTLFQEASGAPKDGNEAEPEVPFCAGQIGMMLRPGWVMGSLADEEIGCPKLAKQVGVFALPGSDGEPAPVLLGGSNIAVSAKSPNQDLAKKLVELMLSDEFQTQYAENGLTPAKVSLAKHLGDDEFADATRAAVTNAKLTPAAAGWAKVEGARVLEDLFVGIAHGQDVEKLAAEADETITRLLASG